MGTPAQVKNRAVMSKDLTYVCDIIQFTKDISKPFNGV